MDLPIWQQELEEFKRQVSEEISNLKLEIKSKYDLKPEEMLKTYDRLKIIKGNIGLPVFTSAPTYTGFQGEVVLLDDGSSTRKIYIYLNGTWRHASLT
jgi:hypothetical protein